jgi:hypothetical protein
MGENDKKRTVSKIHEEEHYLTERQTEWNREAIVQYADVL